MSEQKNPVVVLYTAKAKPSKEQELRDLFTNMVTGSRNDPGCISYELHEVEEDPSTFIIYEQWMTADLLASLLDTAPLRELRVRAGELIEGGFEAGMRHLKRLRPQPTPPVQRSSR